MAGELGGLQRHTRAVVKSVSLFLTRILIIDQSINR